jgi:hypothetical protein
VNYGGGGVLLDQLPTQLTCLTDIKDPSHWVKKHFELGSLAVIHHDSSRTALPYGHIKKGQPSDKKGLRMDSHGHAG